MKPKQVEKLVEALQVSKGIVWWALDHGANKEATQAVLRMIHGALKSSQVRP